MQQCPQYLVEQAVRRVCRLPKGQNAVAIILLLLVLLWLPPTLFIGIAQVLF